MTKTPAFVVCSLESQSAVSPITFRGGEDFDDNLTSAKAFAIEQSTPAFDFQANERLGDAMEIAAKMLNRKDGLSRSERGWCVLWAMADQSYTLLRDELKALHDGGTLSYDQRCVLPALKADKIIRLFTARA